MRLVRLLVNPREIIRRVWRRLTAAKRRGEERAALDAQCRAFAATVVHVSGKNLIRVEKQSVILVCLVKNGQDYIDVFLSHYRRLGVTHFVFLDNGSTDQTIDILKPCSDVTVLLSNASYKDLKFIMKRYLVSTYGRGNWVLSVDIDELFEFPYRDGRTLEDLTAYLMRNRYTAAAAQMLDLFPKEGELLCEPWCETHVYYNNSDIQKLPYDRARLDNIRLPRIQLELFYGGIRSTKYSIRPLLTKHPLIYPDETLDFYHHHYIRNARVADFTAVLKHYKYVGDYFFRFSSAVSQGQYYNNSEEYKGYVDKLEASGQLGLFDESARQLIGVDQLIEEGFLKCSARYEDHFKPAPKIKASDHAARLRPVE